MMNCDREPLTRDDLIALRRADSVVFDHVPGEGGRIRCYLEARNDPNAVFGQSARGERVILVGSNLTNSTGFVHFSSAKYSDIWPTIVSLLQIGDKLSLVWEADHHTNDYVKAASADGVRLREDDHRIYFNGLHADTLMLRVQRPCTRNGRPNFKQLHFTLSTSICPDNTARMIRPAEYSLVRASA